MGGRTTAILIAILGAIVGTTSAQAAAPTLQICNGDFALCAASPCTPTGKQIKVNGSTFQEASCTCPILRGPAVADITGGNMKGSCAAPEAPGGVWSLFAPREHIPQAITNWSRVPSKSAAKILICPASLNLGEQMVNCFSFACTKIKPIHGVEVADCRCPIGVGLLNAPQPAATTFGTLAGQGDPNYCAKHPVSTALP